VHLPAAEHVNVQMVNRLAAVFPAVDHGPKPRRQAFFGGKFGRDRQQMPEERRVSPRNMPERDQMFSGYDEKVNGGAGRDIGKRDRLLILVEPGCRNLPVDVPAEDTVQGGTALSRMLCA